MDMNDITNEARSVRSFLLCNNDAVLDEKIPQSRIHQSLAHQGVMVGDVPEHVQLDL